MKFVGKVAVEVFRANQRMPRSEKSPHGIKLIRFTMSQCPLTTAGWRVTIDHKRRDIELTRHWCERGEFERKL